MSSDAARLAWGVLAIVGGLAWMVGLVASARAIGVAWSRWQVFRDGVSRRITRRDLIMLGLLATASLFGIATSVMLVGLTALYGPDLDAVLEHLAIPVMATYIGYTLSSTLVGAIAPIWIVARWRGARPVRKKGGGDAKQG